MVQGRQGHGHFHVTVLQTMTGEGPAFLSACQCFYVHSSEGQFLFQHLIGIGKGYWFPVNQDVKNIFSRFMLWLGRFKPRSKLCLYLKSGGVPFCSLTPQESCLFKQSTFGRQTGRCRMETYGKGNLRPSEGQTALTYC